MPRGQLFDPPGQGTPCRVPSSPLSAALLHVLPSLEGQTTIKSDKTRTIATVTKRPSQRQKNRRATSTAIEEKPGKTKETKRNDEQKKRNDPPGAPHLGARPWEVGH